MPYSGQTVGNIRLLELVGTGGMGEVWVGQDERLRRKVARLAAGYRPRGAWSDYTRTCSYDAEADQAKRSLVQFVRDDRKARCPVCKLPTEIRAQLREAKDKRISVATQLHWLKEEYKIVLTVEQINAHRGGRHEESAV